MRTNIGDTLVEWDESKNQINIRKHGISFETAAPVFADEERIEYYDKLHSLDEDRYVVLGCVQGVLYVVYTLRDEAARLISARLATSTERKCIMAENENIVRKVIHAGQQPTEAQTLEIEMAASRPVVPDKDAPELTMEQYAEMAEIAKARRSQRVKPVVALRISPETLEKAKATGKGYTGFLSRLLDNAINDPQMVSRSL